VFIKVLLLFKAAKLLNNDETEKGFWKINAVMATKGAIFFCVLDIFRNFASENVCFLIF